MGPVKPHHPWSGGLVLAAIVSTCAVAQTAPTAPAPAASAPAPAASAPRGARPQAAPPSQRVEITGGRESDADQRRQSTAAKIVIGREEIERFGDSSVSEVLKRLPGVTTSGPPGRGGPPRMRGLGAGYTQILVDGQRAPAGFSLDQLTPEQLERIEIFRAPTAETGARAIGGTINIVLREAFRARLNDVRTGVGRTARREPSVTHGGMMRRNLSRCAPSAPNTARRMAFSVMRIIGSSVSNACPSGQFADSRSVSSSKIRS
mgnify:CR=1 FL=1